LAKPVFGVRLRGVYLALVDDPVFQRHVEPDGHPESRARLASARRGMFAGAGQLDVRTLPERDIDDLELLRVHTHEHVAHVTGMDGRSGQLDPDTYVAEGSHAAARRAAGGALALVDALHAGADFGFALSRPPGHHALAETSMGFCIFNNAALAAAHARSLGVPRVMVVDWDVHHGNGTEALFYDRSDVLFLSLHQSPFYPGTGAVSDTGVGDGIGYTVNLPFRARANDAVYSAAFERVVLPVVRQYAPELTIVSAGYDAHRNDPLGQMALSDGAFGAMTRALRRVLPRTGRGNLMFLLEGGYDLDGLEGGVRQTAEALSASTSTDVSDAEAPVAPPWQRELELVVATHRSRWDVR
jgi:acetoin utilization deacetylase AcuC-like enzyme